jgi:hypothetical protein
MSGDIEVVNEPQPPFRSSGKRSLKGGAHILFVEEKTGKQVAEVITPEYIHENERQLREERKY